MTLVRFKSEAFDVQEMGESGESVGSLKLGVASGDIFWIVYRSPSGRGRASTGPSVPVQGAAGCKRRQRAAAIWWSVVVAFASCSVS